MVKRILGGWAELRIIARSSRPSSLLAAAFFALPLLGYMAPIAAQAQIRDQANVPVMQVNAGPDTTAPAPGTAPQGETMSLEEALLHDPTCPGAGNPGGDVTIVAFTDYNCPFCKRSAASLAAFVASDPKVRVVYKDWPILAKSSLTTAKIAIAAAWQGKYAEVHDALMRMNSRPATSEDITRAVMASGADISRLNRDLDLRDDEIVSLLKRNIAEADALGLRGTPVYIIGHSIEASALDKAGFEKAVEAARHEAEHGDKESKPQN